MPSPHVEASHLQSLGQVGQLSPGSQVPLPHTAPAGVPQSGESFGVVTQPV